MSYVSSPRFLVLHSLRVKGFATPDGVAAASGVEMGSMEWFTGALMESYHTVWLELHEDLLATLAIDRAKEAAR